MQETLVDYRETYSFQPVDSFSASRLSDAPTLEQVLQVAERLRAAEPQYRYLCTLDDVNQSCYTRGHALEDERLTFDYDYDDLDLTIPSPCAPTSRAGWRTWWPSFRIRSCNRPGNRCPARSTSTPATSPRWPR